MNDIVKQRSRERSKKWRDKNIEKSRISTRKHYHSNKEYYAKKRRARYLKHREDELQSAKNKHNINKDIPKDNRLKRLYGMTIQDYYSLLEMQNNVCAICFKQETILDNKQGIIRRLAVDHCHETGKIRGLLCYRCNIGLGKFRHSIQILENATKYLNNQTNVILSKSL